MDKRIVSFDILKGLGIILVMVGHLPYIYNGGFIYRMIYGFHMPLFFFISGYFFKEKQLGIDVLNSIRRLIVPYVFFVFCNIAVSFVTIYHGTGSLPTTTHMVFSDLNSKSILENSSLLYSAIWYIICLFLLKILYQILFQLLSGKIQLLFGISLILYVISYFLSVCNINLPFCIDTMMTVFVFYCIGNICMSYSFLIKNNSVLAFVLFCAYTACCVYLEPDVKIARNVFPIYLLFYSFMAIVPFLYIANMLSANIISTIFSYIGKRSLVILGLHLPCYQIVSFFLRMLRLSQLFSEIIMLLLSLLLILLIERILVRFTPNLIGKSK